MRIGTRNVQDGLAAAMTANLRQVNELHQQLSSGKRAPDYGGLGGVGRIVGARALSAREQAYVAAGARVAARLETQDMQLGSLWEAGQGVRTALLRSLGTGDMAGVREAAQALFDQARASLNARDGDGMLFATPNGDAAFAPATLADLSVLPNGDVLAPGASRPTALVGDDRAMTYGFTAREVGGAVTEVLHRLGQLPPAGVVTPALKADLEAIVTDLDGALAGLSAQRAANGRQQAEVERLGAASQARADLLDKEVSGLEDADLAEVSTRLLAAQSALQASYALYGRLREMSLVNYLG